MTQSTVTYPREEALRDLKGEIIKRLDNLETKVEGMQKDIQELKVDLAEVKTTVGSMDKRLTRLENTLTIQLWALILAVVGAIVKFGFFPNP